jgi:hopanoid biosynthesis associated protein HpnK
LKGLIVTADDFGAAVEVNEAIELAHRDGILTAASLMVGAPAAADAVARARDMPSLRIGLHLVLVDGRPMLPAKAIPDLVGPDGNFRNDMVRAGAAMFFLPHVREQLAHEIAAQFEAFAATRLKLDHVNAHKHFHLHPTIADLIVETGAEFGLRAVRVPRESASILSSIDGRVRARVAPLFAMTALLRTKLRRAGLMTSDRVFGLAWSGAMTKDRLNGLITHLPDGLNEIYLHPATSDDFPGSSPGYRYRDELAALLDPATIAAARRDGVRLGGFADFPPRR